MERNMKNKKSKTIFLCKIMICLALLFVMSLSIDTSSVSLATEEKEYCYLSDITAKSAVVGDKTLLLDKNYNGKLITVSVDGEDKTFFKGVFAHAASTVIYDLRNYQYDYFTAYIGLDVANRAQAQGDGVKFKIYTSQDEENWTEILQDNNSYKTTTDSRFVKLDIKNAKYLKLVAEPGRNNWSDHAVYANAKLIKEGYVETDDVKVDFIKTIAEYDQIIKSHQGEEITGEYEMALLQREFVNHLGYDYLQFLVNYNNDYKETIQWLITDIENLRLYILGGKPDGGSYINSLNELSRLYTTYKEDFKDTTPTNNKWYPDLTKGDVYKKMAISLSLTHSTAVGYWAQINHPSNRSDALERYRIYKYMYDNGKFVVSSRQDHTPWFEALQVEEMRYVMNNITDDEELIWLNEYTQKRIDSHPNQEEKYLQPHTYIAYVYPNFENPIFHDPARKDYWDEKFEGIFSKYGVTYSTPDDHVYKAWMSMRNEFGTGAVCGGISKLGTHIRAAHGTPASVISQPGHAAIIYYRKDANGNGYWSMDNGINGWGESGKTEKLGTRMPLGWGSDSYVSGWAASYIVLSQEALNHNEDYEKSEKIIMLANLYNNEPAKKEQYLRDALDILPYNVDAWWELIKLYKANENTTEAQYFALATEMAEALKAFPLPMYNLTNLLKNNLTSTEYAFAFSLLQTRILTEGKNASSETVNVYQPSITKDVASFLLGQMDTTLASFSFDGENARKIVLSNRFDGSGIRWDYSLDGKQNWTEVSFTADEEHKLQLTPEQIASITAENDIYIHIVGANYNEENLYKIDIQESRGLPSTLYANDLENKLIAANPVMQWKYREEDNWTFYRDEEPDLTGDKSVIVRMGATGVYLASTTSTTYQFTRNNDPDTRKYVPISHLSIHGVSTEATSNGGAAANSIDGNANTRYHSAWNGSDTERYMVIKLDEPVYLSAVEFVPAGGGNGKIYDGTIYGSMDGENWEILSRQTNLSYTNQANSVEQAIANIKAFEVDNPSKVQYVKIVADRTNGNWFAARMFNFYEDKTVKTAVKFSFDGENAGKIMLEGELENANWSYSIDGGATWKAANGKEHQLTAEEVDKISEENKIKVRFEGNEAESTINIRTGETPQITPYANDLENRLIGLNHVNTLEWRVSGENTWKSYAEEEPIVIGNKTLFVRTKGTGIYTPSEVLEYQFTEDNQPDTAKYIPIKHLSIHGFSTQSVDSGRPFYAPNAIDGNMNTMWHTDFRYNVLQQDVTPFVTIKLDEAKYISALEFVQKKYKTNDPDAIKNAIVYVSMDGEEWVEAGRKENCEQNEEFKKIEFAESMQAQYVKLEMETYDMFASAAMINLYEDTTKQETPEPVIPTADVQYDRTELTNKNVTATLVNPSTQITVTNNNGSLSYTFTRNGEFTFEFVDQAGNRGTATATVNWIDKVAPKATIEYSTTESTNQDVIATITFDKENVTVVGGNTHTFTENGEYTFEFADQAGNEGRATATVTWIEKEPDVPTPPEKPEGITSEVYQIEKGYISRISPETTVSEFKNNVETEQEMTFTDQNGKELSEDSILATGMKLKVGENLDFTLIVTGDINGDGKITITDFAKLKMHLIEVKLLTGNELKAADMNRDGKVTTTDFAQFKLVLIGKMEVK